MFDAKIGKIFFIGIGGIGMSGIAEVLVNLGFQVFGSDISENLNITRLRKLGVKINIGHIKENINSAASLGIKKGDINQGDSSEFGLTLTKQGKNKNAMFSFTKKLNRIKTLKKSEGGMARGTGAAIRGKGFKGIF